MAGPLLLRRLGIAPSTICHCLLGIPWVLRLCAAVRWSGAVLRLLAICWCGILLRWLVLRVLCLRLCGTGLLIRLLHLSRRLLVLSLLHWLLLVLSLLHWLLLVLSLLHWLLLVLLLRLVMSLLRLRWRILLLLMLRVRPRRQRWRPLRQRRRWWQRRQRRRGPRRKVAWRQRWGILGQWWRRMLLLHLHPWLSRVASRLWLLRWLLERLLLLGCRRRRRRPAAASCYMRLLQLLPGLLLHGLRGRGVAGLLPSALGGPGVRGDCLRLMGLPRILLRVVLLLHVLLLLLRGPAGRRLEGVAGLLRHRRPPCAAAVLETTPGHCKVSGRQ